MENIFSGDCFSNTKNYKSKNSTREGSADNIQLDRSSRSRSSSSSADSSSSSSGGSASSGNSSSRMSSSRSATTLTASHGSVSMCSRRRDMEDTLVVEPGFVQSSSTAEIETQTFDFYAVYDGHGGCQVAQLCKNRLHQIVAEEIHEMIMISSGGGGGGPGGEEEGVVERNWERVMKSCFMRMDEEIDGRSGIEEEVGEVSMMTIGSTAVVAVVGKEKLVVANCGDSRAVLSRGGVAVPLSSDHKPERPDEMERVEAAGGRVIDWNGYRVLGVLATSRSIGDHYLKPYVISEPEVIEMERTTNDEFMILASDGLWDVMSNEVACDVVRRCLDGRTVRELSTNVEGNNAGEAAVVLAKLAVARGSEDNISVIIVELNQSSRNIF